VTSRGVYALFSPRPRGREADAGPRIETRTTGVVGSVVLGQSDKPLILWGFFPTYYEDYEYYRGEPYVRVRAHEVRGCSIRSIRSPLSEKTIFSIPYRERERLQSLLLCVCVCSITSSYPCRIVAKRLSIWTWAEDEEALEPQAHTLTAGPSRHRIIPCCFNHCHIVSYLTKQTVTIPDFYLVCRARSRNGLFCNVYQPIDIQWVSGRAPGRAPGFWSVSKAENKGSGLYSFLSLRAHARDPPPARPRLGAGVDTRLLAQRPEKNFRLPGGIA
jgi:hypothetical protein